ncbi:MAG: SGNH/GDSL hydrolase family protein, partial [bacterium]
PENPLGIVKEIPYEPVYDGEVILFYGDSFVFGATEMEEKIPQQLNRLLPEYTVYNYGVGGYGVDQIYLRFKQSYEKFQSPLIIFGILTTDLDRSVLTVRSYQKPYYKIENDELILHGVPINMNPEEWLEQNPPRIYSYLGAFLFRRLCLLGSEGVRIEQFYRRNEKKRINGRIIEEVVKECREKKMPLLFVVFYTQYELRKTLWREIFLKEEICRWNVPWIDTKDVLLAAANNDVTKIAEYYLRNLHLNGEANGIVARAIADRVKKMEDVSDSVAKETRADSSR